MAQEWAIWFYSSIIWIRCRDAYKQSQHGICERCGMPGTEVHHKIYLTPENINDPYITLSWDNLELLCASCHSIEHNRKYKEVVREGLRFDNLGNLVEDKG